MARRRGMGFGEHDVDRIAEEVLALDAGGTCQRLVLPLVGEDEVDVPEGQRGQRLLGLGLDQLTAEIGRIPRERAHGRYGEMEGGGLKRRDPPPSRNPAGRGGELGLCALGALEQCAGVTDEHQRGVGQPDASSGTLEERHARLALEHRELLARPPTA